MASHPDTLIRKLTCTPVLRQLTSPQVQFVIAIRIAALAKMKKLNIHSYLNKHFNNDAIALHFSHMMEAIDDCWPEPLLAHKPCCQRTSYDEMLIIDLIKAASLRRTNHFHGLLCEMLSKSDCERLHHIIVRLIEGLQHKEAKE